ncbi:MAG: 50S ribosomal protein L9 [Rhodospirillales bacterium]|nr:50S ribosomal protein L9 [Rhodospirillales bacterium]
MEVILLERIEGWGQMGDVVKVRPGYARNYLLPQKKALRATKANLAYFETRRAQLEATNLAKREEAEQVGNKIDGLAVVLIRQASETGQLYGSVTARDIADGLHEQGLTVERSQVVLDRPIKTLGLNNIRVRLHPEVSVTITVNVARTAEEAEMQAESGEMVTAESLRRAADAEDEAIEAALTAAEAGQAEASEEEAAGEAPKSGA